MCLSATLTIVPSRKTAPDPMTVQTRVQRWRDVMPLAADGEWARRSLPGSVAARDGSRQGPGRLSAMPGPVALVGAGEFLPAMAEFDAGLLASTGRARPRVVILPTASFPDGEEVFLRWATMGVAHFGALGAEVEPVLVRDRAGADDPAAAQAIGEADLVYLSGGKPGLPDAACSTAARSGGPWPTRTSAARSLAGCSAGAMVLAGHAFDFRRPAGALAAALAAGLGFVPRRRRSSRTTTPGRSRCPR